MFDRAESGAARYRLEPLDLAALVRSVVAEFQTQAAPWQVEMSLGDAPCVVHGDPELLSLALWNLLDNAVKYSLDSRTIWVDLGCTATRATLSVRDRGMGTPDDEQARVFMKFVRGTQTAASPIKGTGIGLALVHHVVGAHGGTVRLESRVGEGSTFTIELPSCRDSGFGVLDSGSGRTGGSAPTG